VSAPQPSAFAAGVVSVDGVLAPIADARVPVLDRGYLYGDAVFEALRTFGGRPDALDEHLARLGRSCARIGMPMPVSAERFAHEVHAAIAAVPSEERYLRIMITRGDRPEAIAPSDDVSPRRVIIVRPLSAAPPELEPPSIRLATAVSPPSPLYAGAKPTAYLANLLAIAGAQRAGADDALLLGAHGEVLEGATSSVFFVQGGAITTPPLALGILPGITRDRVLRLAAEAGFPVRESLSFIDAAYRADEIFLTSSVRGIVSAVALDGRPIGDGKPGSVARSVRRTYLAFVRGLDQAQSRG
jgi:branched-chain amino acid aminotransferase